MIFYKPYKLYAFVGLKKYCKLKIEDPNNLGFLCLI